MQNERQGKVLDLLKKMEGMEALKELIWSELNYERVNQPLSRRDWTQTAAQVLAEDPILFAGGGQDKSFHVIYTRLVSDRLKTGSERQVVSRLLRDHPYSLFIVSNYDQNQWHFINVKYDPQTEKRRLFRRITIGHEERLRTASERVSMLDIGTVHPDLFGISSLAIQQRHDEAFDVEAVTKQFFNEYQTVFRALQKDLAGQTKDQEWAHDYSLQFLNRTMFLYFVQRKRWLNNDTEFLRTFWESYHEAGQQPDTFFEQWLSVLFFEAFNNKFHGGHKHFPEEIRKALHMAPYLNGGLFQQNDLDRAQSFTITDARFRNVFAFLERYNFTIAEDSPLDQEVAVDPEMIGKVYESLVNVSAEADERGDAGIFYTPRTEIDLMCRLALLEYLTNHIGSEHRPLLNEFVFALEPEEKESADAKLLHVNLWTRLFPMLRDITVLDPACGSGSFLVGMLHILDDMQKRGLRTLDIQESNFDRRKRIIGTSLYGVDVMKWACHVTELRLWLSLIVDAEFKSEELHFRQDPLLPHFTFKIRCGDSLAQDIAGINVRNLVATKQISRGLKERIARLKNEKLKFFKNDASGVFRSENELRHEEFILYRELLETRRKEIQEEIKKLQERMDAPAYGQMTLDGTKEDRSIQMTLDHEKMRRDIENLARDRDMLGSACAALRSYADIPLVWDMSFVEIFESDNAGFDIVIGNPPYVRQENIADPFLHRDKVTVENKKAYKERLMRSVYRTYPTFFGYRESGSSCSVTHRLDAKSDLYIYFYLHGLSLLNEKGSFCFITSNSWLDVGYGADLQEFLLKKCRVKMVIDNQVKRSFASADVNTVIVLISPPVRDPESDESRLQNTVKFVMFTAPFEHILSPVIFDEIEAAGERGRTKEYRIFPITQQKLLEHGCEIDEEGTACRAPTTLIKAAKYIGNKWGGKYLRAPDIYWTILEKGKGKLVRLGDVAEVRFGIKTGANEFFYLDAEKIQEWGIEEEFLKPVIKSPRECKRILIDPKELKYKIFMCHKDRNELKGTSAFEYIKWGESQEFHERPSCRGRARWWDVGERRIAPIISPSSISELFRTFENIGIFADKRLYEIYSDSGWVNLLFVTNATLCSLFLELGSRTGLGEGLLDLTVYEVADCIIVDPDLLNQCNLGNIRKRNVLPINIEISQPDRRALDSIIFDALNLTQGERDAVYEAVIDLVSARLKKARSL